MASDILKDDFKSLEALRTAFPTFIRDYAMWKRCYYADHSSWSTAEFHINCDFKGPSLTVIRVREYVFGGFVDQSWGGRYYNRIRSLLFKQSDLHYGHTAYYVHFLIRTLRGPGYFPKRAPV